ncbi:MAG: GNAT family N-acetyltransferase [Clostridia bacterium]|nr:GNAT family N-acetyltransferase [Clostridia bacterium]
MIIRDLMQQDVSQLSLLYEQFWGDKSDLLKMKNELSIIKNENRHIILVAEINEKVVGSVMGIVCRELYGDCKPFLIVENMIVNKEIRRSGVGKGLLSELEKRAKNINCTQMILVTESDRIDACCFYEKYGFQKNNKGYKKKL